MSATSPTQQQAQQALASPALASPTQAAAVAATTTPTAANAAAVTSPQQAPQQQSDAAAAAAGNTTTSANNTNTAATNTNNNNNNNNNNGNGNGNGNGNSAQQTTQGQAQAQATAQAPATGTTSAQNQSAPATNAASADSNTPAPTSATPQSATSTTAEVPLICKWNECNEPFATAEALYEHLCEKHVGRKSTNNLNLTCQWNQCRTTTVKRDHITSHIRVHVPLKPHKCDFCGKAFKRPQDLKKHVKTHADDSVLVGPRTAQDPQGLNANYRATPRAPPSMYDQHGHMRGANQGHFAAPPQNGQPNYYQPPAPPHPSYHPSMYGYQQPPPMGGGAPRPDYLSHQAAAAPAPSPSFGEVRRRGMDDLNEFFGALKRRQIDPTSYQQIGRSLMPLHASLGFSAGGGLAAEYMPQPPHTLGVAGSHGPLTQHYYLPPMPNLRTKEDLQQIDHILEQMQATVYETAGSPAAQYPPVDLRHSPTAYAPRGPAPAAAAAANPADQYAVSAAQVVSPLTAPASSTGGTPAVTPPSSTISYASAHSPTASSSGMSPSSRHNSTSAPVSYPSLPSRPGLPYPTATALGSNFAHNERRLSGGMLQSASSIARRDSDRTPTPKGVAAAADGTAVSSPSDASEHGTETDSYEGTQLYRLIEALRISIRQRLQRGEYEVDSDSNQMQIDPALHGNQADNVGNADDSTNINGNGSAREDRVSYPSLPSA
ncbi:uncharacterized protein CTHT_0025430 [Thermochaetoides thermophila DSM 1495]|uniref:C2H2-type domain-containing protein n=1 Tax=Chaetomium thermophilum (strain DSM 1495 / CBS 144.50 / IMI 039719) TaxID=759272 RepID=G0S5Z1_CHATD|nr:hypothetical protein CTHT_0025430 [Thermochaetoides thermophila DSM 1495]EGS20707.1 hypothetical protein CTHT_0025430 [Thermochaetoides thermophila DSM 1495]